MADALDWLQQLLGERDPATLPRAPVKKPSDWNPDAAPEFAWAYENQPFGQLKYRDQVGPPTYNNIETDPADAAVYRGDGPPKLGQIPPSPWSNPTWNKDSGWQSGASNPIISDAPFSVWLPEALGGGWISDRSRQQQPARLDMEEPGPPNILDYLQGMLGRGRGMGEDAINRYWKLRGLPDAVKTSILSQPSYAEGDRSLPPDPARAAGREALASEYERAPGADYRNSQLMRELDMARRLYQGGGVRSDSINPSASTWSPESPYPAPLPPAGQRFPFGMY